ncbi:hypothetical protein [Arthrobacter sp. PAMC25284]|uniref:hypothetical protein n=1 Tax=Arthrobacter sp. PAMC25284 TaxID=2861279 RepID=UPI001C63189B|nr:hypothetical protein [Arthrobacter sp. PAMC25284]QYF88494.1 hypothetical protein KY499_09355 [Arthrobacter sp. PAMC25284]
MSRWSPYVTISEVPDASRERILEAAEFPLTIMGLAERFAVHYGDRVAFVDGDWRLALHGEWYPNARSTCALHVLAVVRSLSVSEIESRKRAESEYVDAAPAVREQPRCRRASPQYCPVLGLPGRIHIHS